MIEAAANSRLQASLDRIDANNKAIEAGGDGEFGRPITVRMLRRRCRSTTCSPSQVTVWPSASSWASDGTSMV